MIHISALHGHCPGQIMQQSWTLSPKEAISDAVEGSKICSELETPNNFCQSSVSTFSVPPKRKSVLKTCLDFFVYLALHYYTKVFENPLVKTIREN